MSGLGFASSAGAIACPYGTTQWVVPYNTTPGDTGTGAVMNNGFAWPRRLYGVPLPTNAVTTPFVEVPDGAQRDWRAGRAQAAAFVGESLSAPKGTTLVASGLAMPSLSWAATAGTLKTIPLGVEDSGTSVFLSNLGVGVSGNVTIALPDIVPASAGFTCKLVLTQQNAPAGAVPGSVKFTANARFGFTAYWGASYMWGGYGAGGGAAVAAAGGVQAQGAVPHIPDANNPVLLQTFTLGGSNVSTAYPPDGTVVEVFYEAQSALNTVAVYFKVTSPIGGGMTMTAS